MLNLLSLKCSGKLINGCDDQFLAGTDGAPSGNIVPLFNIPDSNPVCNGNMGQGFAFLNDVGNILYIGFALGHSFFISACLTFWNSD